MDDDKARRNLVMVSAAILLAGWLDLPLTEIAERVLGIKGGDKIDPTRAWSAVCAVLLYLAYRFSFSNDEQQARDAFYTDWQTQRDKRQRRVLLREARQAAAGAKPVSEFGNEVSAHFDLADESNGIERRSGGVITVDVQSFGVQRIEKWSGKVSIGWSAVRASGNLISSSGSVIPYRFSPLRARLPIIAAVAFIVVFRSKTTSAAVFPVALALSAMACASFQAMSAWLR